MAPAFSKEAVLCGSVDNLCLVCESYLRSEREVCLHVTTPAHSRNLDSTDYVDKYRNDRVRKVKKRYFCEFCNVLVSTITAVGLHVEEPRHKENKSSLIIKRHDNVVVCGDIPVSDDAWHSFIDENTCSICNVEFDDSDVHKTEPTHVIKLIQSKVSFVNNSVYRKIDDSTFHCLTCNMIVVKITTHIEDADHKMKLQDSATSIPSKQVKDKIHNISDIAKDNNKNSSDILDSITKFQKNDININFESCTAFCRRCSLDLEFSCKAIQNHIEEHKNNIQAKRPGAQPISESGEKSNVKDSGTSFASPVFKMSERENKDNIETIPTGMTKPKNDIQKTAEEHDLTYITVSNEVYCRICNKNIPSSVAKIIGHVNTESHKGKKPTAKKDNEITKKNAKKCNLIKMIFVRFARNVHRIETKLTEVVVVNDKYCIDVLNFFFLTMTSPGRIRCQVCEISMQYEDVDGHVDVEKHERAILEVPVIIRPDSEFIREIRTGIFQCGYCNIYDDWEGMQNHLKSTNHQETRGFAERRLSVLQSQIMEMRLKRHIEREFLKLLFS